MKLKVRWLLVVQDGSMLAACASVLSTWPEVKEAVSRILTAKGWEAQPWEKQNATCALMAGPPGNGWLVAVWKYEEVEDSPPAKAAAVTKARAAAQA
ncbi:MAG: hypothetical protein ACRETH_07335 [Steroidobacteraceae bacterium]